MSYKIHSFENQVLTLQRKGVFLKTFIVITVGLFFFTLGITFFLFQWNIQSVESFHISNLLFIFGMIAILSGISIPSHHRKNVPEKITFDNNKGWVKIEQSMGSDKVSYIPYDSIQDFYIDVQTQRKSNNQTVSTKIYHYHVMLRKKDSGEWELFYSQSKSKAEAFLAELKNRIKLENPAHILPRPVLSDIVIKDQKGDKVMIRWKNKGVLGLIILGLVAGLFGYVFWFIFARSEMPVFGYISLSIFVLVFGFIFYINSSKMIKNITRVYGFSLNKNQFEYFEEDHSGNQLKSELIPVNDLGGISLTFHPNRDLHQPCALFVYRKSDIERRNDFFKGGNKMSMVQDSIGFYTNLMALDIASLNAVEKLEMERWIELILKEKAGLEGL